MEGLFFSLVFMPLKDIKLANSIFCNANWCVRGHITVFRGEFFYWRVFTMMGIGFPELMIILVIIMIIFGAGKLPEIGSAFGRSIKNFKTSMKEAEEGDVVEGELSKPGELAEADLDNMTEEEKEAYLRKKAEEEGEAKDKQMKDEADLFTSTLPRKGSYDYSQDEEKKG